jgi:Tlde1 domain
MLDPMPVLDVQLLAFRSSAPLDAAFRLAAVRPDVPVESPALPSAPTGHDRSAPTSLGEKAVSPTRIIPLPAPRPVEAREQRAPETIGMASGPSNRRTRIAAVPPTPEVNRSFFERLFGVQPQPGPALGYAALDGTVRMAPNSGLDFKPASGSGTAVYDISARVVYLPDGERLEAHSGLGDKLDDPRYVHVRMLGATPPGTYELTEREQLFHGVRALRLNPVGGAMAVHGRAGLLAHTYMLGPNGDSNGCVSFRDYNKFLQAYLRGSVKRLVVVAGGGQDALRSLANGQIGVRQRFAKS